MGSIYKGSFVNTQVDYTDNSPNEQTFYVTITDLSTTELEYGLSFLAVPIGGGQQSMTVNWAGLPIDTTSLIIGYSLAGVGSYTDITVNNPAPTDFYTWNVAVGNYDIRIQVVRSAGPTETYYIYYLEYQLEMSEAPIVLQTVDNSEDKFTPIKSKSCTISVFTNDDVNAMTFAGGGDTQYKVEVAVNAESQIIYTGWLSLSDLGQTFQPDPNVLTLTATDGIAFLDSVPLTDNHGSYLQGPHPLIKYIAWALQKTGIELEIWVQMNLLEVNSIYDYPEYHFYNTVFLDAQTFEADLGELEDCYTVLKKILGEFCEISQQKNVWFIKSIDEANYAQFRICRFDYNGNPVDYITELYAKDIGADSDYYTMAFMNDDARLSLQRPYKSVIHKFDYNYPAEIVQNIDFEKGIATTEPDPTAPTSTGIYNPQGWTLARASDGTSGIWLDLYKQAGARGEIIKEFEYGYEKDRYMVVEHEDVAGDDFIHYVKSTPFYVQKGDRLNISVDVGQNVNLNIINPVHVWLESDTSYYTWQLDTTSLTPEGDPIINQWVAKPKPLTAAIADNPFTQMWRLQLDSALDPEDELPKYTSIQGEIDVPADGKIWVRLCVNSNIFAPLFFSNLNIDITPRVNGSYQKYTGQQHTSEQDIDTLAIREESVSMSDAPRIEMKGSMLRRLIGDTLYTGNAAFETGNGVTLDGFLTPIFNVDDYIRIINTTNNNGTFRIVATNYSFVTNKTVLEFDEATVFEVDASTTIQAYMYELTENFYDSIDYPGGGAPQSAQLPYGQHQNQAVWNQYNRVFSIFEATIDGLDTDTVDNLGLPDLPDLMHMYRQNDTHPATYNKQFKCLHYEQDTDNCEWSIYMIEVGDGSIPKSYDGHTFKYFQK
jgi:hypothetical protein